MSKREPYIDHLRTVMTAMVIFAHAAITYGGTGDWFYVEIHQPQARSTILFSLFVATCSVSLMGCFFLLAGYFAPGSLERKGSKRFVEERLLRLGVPLLLFGLLVAPVTIGLSAHAVGKSFWPAFVGTLRSIFSAGEFHTGPMWFAEDLLLFSLGYCVLHALQSRGASPTPETQAAAPLPPQWLWFLSALAIGAVTLMVRQVFPIDARVGGIWPGALPLYIFLFAMGILAWRRDWLRQFAWKKLWPSIVIACLAWPAMPIGTAIFVARGMSITEVRGFSPANVILAFWEPLVEFGALAALLLFFRRFLNEPGSLWSWLDRRAYAVYFIHPVILVAVCMPLRHMALPALVKFAAAGCLASIAAWLAADLLIRLPGLKKIL